MEVPSSVHIYQYIDDILVGGNNKKQVGQVAEAIWDLLTKNELAIPTSTCQGLGQEVRFLGAWCIAGPVVVPDDTLSIIKKGQTLGHKTELQQLPGTLGYGTKHVLGFSVIAFPLYDLLQKNREWEWTL